MNILIENVSKKFGLYVGLSKINLEIPTGTLLALLGPSGSGKSTLLRTLAGFEKPDEGRIWFSGKNTTNLTIQKRKIGFVFQDYALFPKMTVFENIAFGLKIQNHVAMQKRWKSDGKAMSKHPKTSQNIPKHQNEISKALSKQPKAILPHPKAMSEHQSATSKAMSKHQSERQRINTQVSELLKLTQLENFATFYPHQLSGGQKQRVAFARALAIEPKVLLLDEPFGALDIKVRKNLRSWLRDLHEKLPVTTIFVTHDIHEAMSIADEIVLLKNGCVVQFGCPQDIYKHPATHFVQNFIGT